MSKKQDKSSDSLTKPAVALGLPPPIDSFPKPDEAFQRMKGGFAPAFRPRNGELNALADAIKELRGFTDWGPTFGKLAPPREDILGAFEAANQWSTMLRATKSWEEFASFQEGVAWIGARDAIARLKPVYDKLAKHDPALGARYPKLAALLGARSEITRKGNNTRAARKKAEEEKKKKNDPKP